MEETTPDLSWLTWEVFEFAVWTFLIVAGVAFHYPIWKGIRYVSDKIRYGWYSLFPQKTHRVRRSSLPYQPPAPPSMPAFVPDVPAQSSDLVPLEQALQAIPSGVNFQQFLHTRPRSSTTLPLGVNEYGEAVWFDLASDVLHIGLYAASGAGKDNLLRAWFLTLAFRNPSDQMQFAILDGKGDWLTSNLAMLEHMHIPPAGGYGKQGDAAIERAIQQIDAEAERRQILITQANCTTREQYVAQTGNNLPMLVIIATDVMTSVAGKVEELLINLVSKARSLGIRVIVSMQTPTGKDTKWRVNLSTVIVGALQSGNQDSPALGIGVREMRYRPSRLPSPQERPGVFVVRKGAEQMLVQAPYVREREFASWMTKLPRKQPVLQPSQWAHEDTDQQPRPGPQPWQQPGQRQSRPERQPQPGQQQPRPGQQPWQQHVQQQPWPQSKPAQQQHRPGQQQPQPEHQYSPGQQPWPQSKPGSQPQPEPASLQFAWSEQHIKVAAWLATEPDIAIREVARRLYPGSDGSGGYSTQARAIIDQVQSVLGVKCEGVKCEGVKCEGVKCESPKEDEKGQNEGDDSARFTLHRLLEIPVPPYTNEEIHPSAHPGKVVPPDTNEEIHPSAHPDEPVPPYTNGEIHPSAHPGKVVPPDTDEEIQAWQDLQTPVSADTNEEVQVFEQIREWKRQGVSRNQMCQRLGGNRTRTYALIKQALGEQ